jgi:hypothetical protein
MVPLTVLVLALDEALLVAELPLDADEELDEEHAARPRAVAATATPTVVTRCLRPNGISGTPYRFCIFSLDRVSSPHSRPACKLRCASTVCRCRRNARANDWWTNKVQKVNFWCLRLARAPRPAG